MEKKAHSLNPEPPFSFVSAADISNRFQREFACETLQLITARQASACSFWIGLAPEGTLTPREILDIQSDPSLLMQVAQAGIAEDKSITLVDSSSEPMRRFHFLRIAAAIDSRRLLEMGEEIVQNVEAWQPNAVGFYLAPTLIHAESMLQLLTKVLTTLVAQKKSRSYFFLRDPEADYNHLLNLMLAVKEEIALEQKEKLLILH